MSSAADISTIGTILGCWTFDDRLQFSARPVNVTGCRLRGEKVVRSILELVRLHGKRVIPNTHLTTYHLKFVDNANYLMPLH